ncbi:15194_t:CDS:2 [Entrophospora sp. SA101]|nr:15194_t:CDS:2 [Entrophospora sp. SA101]
MNAQRNNVEGTSGPTSKGLDQFPESPNSTFFVPEDTAGPDLVFIVQFKGPGENYIDYSVKKLQRLKKRKGLRK